MRSIESNENNDNIIPLQQHLINQTTDPNVTKIRGAPCKKRLKSAMEVSKRKNPICEITSQINIQNTDDGEGNLRSQRKCLLCGKPGHYQKKCPSKGNNREEN
jgi:hypothetical protein